MKLAHAIQTILSAEISAGSIVVKNYETNFDELWDLEKPIDGTVVLVWGDTPPGDAPPVATELYVSPIYWAIRTADLAARNGHSFAITIVDLRPKGRGEIPLHTLLRETGAKGWPSWIRLVGPDKLVVEHYEDLKRLLVPAFSLVDPEDPALLLLKDQVRKHLTDPRERDSRHALANLLGPMILLGDVPTQVPPAEIGLASHREALRQLLKLAGLLPDYESVAAAFTGIFDAGARIFLLDDQWHHGWGQWLCSTLGVDFEAPTVLEGGPQRISESSSKVEVFAAQRPDWLLEKLQHPSTPFQLTLDPAGRPGQEILLLDLRLFAENEAAERAFQEHVRAECRPYENQQPGFSRQDLAAELTDPKSRALLGRLLALKDLSFPVILFSSTSDRSYVKEFENCPNIIPTFAKPGRPGQRFEGLQLETTTPAFFEALREAKKLCDARRFVQQVGVWAGEGLNAATKLIGLPAGSGAQTDKSSNAPWRHAELYVDESGSPESPNFRAGGYIALYRSEDDGPNKLQFPMKWGFSRDEPFDPFAPENRLRLGKAERIPKIPSGRKTSELAERARYVRDVVAAVGGVLAACVVSKGTASGSIPGPDPIYRALAGAAIELFFFDWVPALEAAWGQREGDLTASVFLATRQWVTNPEQVISNQWRFGLPLRSFKPNHRQPANAKLVDQSQTSGLDGFGYARLKGSIREFRAGVRAGELDSRIQGTSIGFGDAYALTVSASHHREQPGFARRLRSAVAVTLDDFERYQRTDKAPPELPRQIHFASDDLLGSAELWSEQPIANALTGGFGVDYGPGLECFLQASRAFDVGNLPRGLTELRQAHRLGVRPSILRWLAVRVLRQICAITPADYFQFVRGAG